MWYPLGQALLYIGIGCAILGMFSIPIARWLGRFTRAAQQQQKETIQAFQQGKEEKL